MTSTPNSGKKLSEPIFKDHVRLLATIETDDVIEEAIGQWIPSHRFVFGVDLKLHRTVKDILTDLRTKLFPESDLSGVHLELYLRTPVEYFIPPWSSACDVLHQDDEVILRFRRSDFKEKVAVHPSCTEKRLLEREVLEDDAEPKRKKCKKRKLDESPAVAAEPITPEFEKGGSEASEEKAHSKKGKKKKKRRPLPDLSSASALKTSNSRQPEDRGASATLQVNYESKSDVSQVDDHSRRKKPRKSAEDLYDNAIVIRSGKTGKIQHVYFDSSPSSTGTEEPEKELEKKKEDESVTDLETTAKITEQLSSKALIKAKRFSLLIDHQTTCEKLGEALRSSSTTENQSSVDGISNGLTSLVPVIVTKNLLNRNRRKGGTDRCSNVSVLVEKASNPPLHSTPVQEITTAQGGVHNDGQCSESRSVPLVNVQKASSTASPRVDSSPVSGKSHQLNGHTKLTGAFATASSLSPHFWAPPRPIQEYPVVKHAAALRVGDRLAYKMMERNEMMELNEVDCTPGISDWKTGQIEALDPEELEIRVKLFAGEARCEVPRKFRFDEEDGVNGQERMDDQGDHADRKQMNQKDVVFWREIVEARLLTE